MSARRCSTSSWLSPPAGSSSSSRVGSLASARASSTRLRVPNGSSSTLSDATCSSPSMAISSSIRCASARSSVCTRGKPQRIRQKPAVGTAMRADHDVAAHRHGAKQREILKCPADPERGDPMTRHVEQRPALKADVALIRGVEPAQAVEQRGLAGPVRARSGRRFRPARYRRKPGRARQCHRNAEKCRGCGAGHCSPILLPHPRRLPPPGHKAPDSKSPKRTHCLPFQRIICMFSIG